MRIGIDADYVTTCVYKSGLYNHVVGVVRGLNQLRPRPTVFLYLSGYTDTKLRRADDFIADNGLVARVRVFNEATGRPYRLRKWLAELQFKLDRIDAFLSVMCPDFPPAANRAVGYLLPDLTTRLAAVYHSAPNADHWERMFAAARKHADVVFTSSEHTRRDVVETLGIPADKVVAVPLAAGDQYRPAAGPTLEAALRPLGLTPGGYALTVGTLEPRKNHVTLFRAYADYLSRPGVPRLPLVVAGPTGWMADSILAEPSRLGIAEFVRFVGRVPDVAALYAGAAAMAYPSHYEGFGLPPLEAMACGTPVIASNATSLPEVVGDAGILVPPDDVRGFADALYAVLTDPARRADLSRRGRERAARFSWAATAQGYLDGFRRALARKRATGRPA